MKTTKEFNQSVKGAKSEVREMIASPFYVTNELNKLAKGIVTRTYGLSADEVRAVAAVSKRLIGGRYAFSVDMFAKDAKGRFCTYTAYKEEKHGPLNVDYQDVEGGSIGIHTLADGREVDVEKGMILNPVKCSFIGMFTAYCRVIASANKADEQAKREAEKVKKAAEKAKHDFEKARAKVKAVFGNLINTMTDEEIAEKYAIIKAA